MSQPTDDGKPALIFYFEGDDDGGGSPGAIASVTIDTETNIPILDETGSALLIE